LPEVEGSKPSKKKFKAYPIGYFHIDIAEVQTAEGKLYLYVAIDRTSKFAFVRLVKKTGRTSASVFLEALIAAVPLQDPHGSHRQWDPVHFPAALRGRPDGKIHDAYVRYALPEKWHRTSADQDQASMDEWPGRAHEPTIKEATVQRYHYDRHDQLEAHLADFINAYNYARG
jgi:Integrase core domain.